MDAGRKIVREGKVRNRVADLDRAFDKSRGMRIVLEASAKAFWMADRLRELGHDPVVVDPGRTKAVGAALIKHHRLDALVLATLGVADVLAKVDPPSEAKRLARMPVVMRDCLIAPLLRTPPCARASRPDPEHVSLAPSIGAPSS